MSGELMFLESYGNCDVTNNSSFMTSRNNLLLRFMINIVTLLLLVYLGELAANSNYPSLVSLIFRRISC